MKLFRRLTKNTLRHVIRWALAVLIVLVLVLALLYWQRRRNSPPNPLQMESNTSIQAVQQQLHISEARARLQALAAGIRAGREGAYLEKHVRVVQRLLEAAYQGDASWSVLEPQLQALRGSFSRNPNVGLAALDTVLKTVNEGLMTGTE